MKVEWLTRSSRYNMRELSNHAAAAEGSAVSLTVMRLVFQMSRH